MSAAKSFAPLRRILVGLAALHQRGLAHGDLRPRNIYLNGPADGVSEDVWIGDTVIGELAHCSRGVMLDADAGHYYPPEWQGVQKPSPKADVYALGLLCCEALAGQNANPHRDGAADGGQAVREEADAALRERGVDAGLRKFIGLLLADESQRPATAAERCWPSTKASGR